MIVEELSVRNWRRFREVHRFTFGAGINLLLGPNEAGKSTLFEAMTRALFDRHTSKATDIRAMQPLGSSLGPEVELTLRVGDERVRVRKRFLVEPLSELSRERGGRFELDDEGDRADAAIRDLLRGGTARGASQSRHRGIAEALWYLQGDDPLPRVQWSAAVRDGIGGLLRLVAQTPLDVGVRESLDKRYSRYFTPAGKPAARGELTILRHEVESLERDAAATAAQLERLRQLRSEVDDLADRRDETAGRSTILEDELASLQPQLARLSEDQQESEALQEKLREAAADRVRIEASLESLRGRQRKIRELDRELESHRQKQEGLRQQSISARKLEEELSLRIAEELEPEIASVEVEIEDLMVAERLEQLATEEIRIGEDLARLRAVEEEVGSLQRALTGVAAPTTEEWVEVEKLVQRLEHLESQLGDTITVKAEVHRPDIEIEVVPPTAADGASAYHLQRTTVFSIANVVDFSVVVGEQEVADELASLEERLAERLADFGCDDVDSLARRFAERQALEAKLVGSRSALESLEEACRDAERRLESARDERGALQVRSSQPLLPGMANWSREQRQQRRLELVGRKESLSRRLLEVRGERRQAQAKHVESLESARRVDRAMSELTNARSALVGAMVADLPEGLVEADLSVELESSQAVVSEIQEKLARLAAASDPEPERRALALRNDIEALREELADIERQIDDRLSRRDELLGVGLYTRLGDLEATLDEKRGRLASVTRQAEGVRLLRLMLAAQREATETALSKPVGEWLDRWWSELTQGDYGSVELDGQLLPSATFSTHYGASLPLADLSFGSSEQIVILLRLALGVSLSAVDRQLVVLDDRLVNADRVRFGRFCDILQQAGEHCQILIASCRPSLYAEVSATRIEVPADGVQQPAPV